MLTVALNSAFLLLFLSTTTIENTPENIIHMSNASRRVLKAVLSREQSEGVGAKVRRSIGSQQLRNLDPFLMLDEFSVTAPAGFPDHPHRGFETVTYMMRGTVQHEDFTGNKGVIEAGSLQWMTAGRGILHAEMPIGTETAHGLQLWINLPRAEKMCAPRYQELIDKDIPHARLQSDKVDIKVIAGESHGVKSAVFTKTPTLYLDFNMQPGASVTQLIPQGWNAFVYIMQGSAKFGGDSEKVQPAHSTLVLSTGSNEDHVAISTPATEGAHFVLIAGKPNNEPIVQHGPFVMNTQQEIQDTFMDYQLGRNGFEGAQGWESSIRK